MANKHSDVQHVNVVRNFIAAQREKMLDKQLHSLMEQLAAKQVPLSSPCSETVHLCHLSSFLYNY